MIPLRRDIRSWYVMAGLMVLAAVLRARGLEGHGLWLDEIWSLMNASGQGRALDALPAGSVQTPGTDWTAIGTLSWWRVWTNSASDVHPPLFYLALRAWMGVFGDSDEASRAMSVMFGTVSAGLMFGLARETVGTGRATLATAVYAVSCGGIFYSQECRSYEMLQCEVLGAAWCAWRITRGRDGWGWTVGLGASLLAGMLTHYFFLGAAAGIVAWTMYATTGRNRRRIAGAAGAAALIFLLVWAPFLWQQRTFWAWHVHLVEGDRSAGMLALRLLSSPARILLPNVRAGAMWAIVLGVWSLVSVPCCAVLGRSDRSRGAGLWWAVLAGGIGLVFAQDLGRHALGLLVPRYVSHLLPALCAVLVTMPFRWGWLPAAVVGVASAYWSYTYAYIPTGHWRDEVAAQFAPRMSPGDAVVFFSPVPDDWRPKMQYLCWSRYEGAARALPHVVLGPASIPAPTESVLQDAHRVWLFSTEPPNGLVFPLPRHTRAEVFSINVYTTETPLSLSIYVPDASPGIP